ncbi:hypothetical protein P3X46_034227 [Hevea brasiliensis]|uniref:Disease resistance RPP13-like protein 1 n=1 Tax=Hevea brasiliensis TaxID=3981 RepID=A0ABQ9K8T7_HEVBR|nr:putative disease resistance protein At3g14460 [Hevea brasiliensis]KAJ9129012.1 hypothetical protein P3X46_034227 [Hevea brasiliensis]
MAEFVGGAILSAFLPVLFERMASEEFLRFFKSRNLNDGLLNKLKTTLNSVDGLLADAEEKQITQPAVKIWLHDLKDAVYDADDLLDEIAYKALQSKLEHASHRQMVKKFLSSHNPFKKDMLEEKLGEILGRLKFLLEQKDPLGLGEKIGENLSLRKTPTTALPDDDESGVYGRDNDKEAIIKILLSDSDTNGLDVIPIVGMGGIGKTILAQLVYNDSRVQHFQPRAWVCVTEEFNVFNVTKGILMEVKPGSHDDKTPNQIQQKLKEELSEKKFLLVLDDLWNDEYDDWNNLRKPLMYGAKGSKILVTTRNESVASVVGAVETYHLEKLTTEDCWSLFEKYAFLNDNSSVHPKLEDIGKEIVSKCDGLPLAAKTLGGLLRAERDAEKWEKIWKSNIWGLSNGRILPALRLSYHYLPSLLKQCFACCAIFPKHYEFDKEDLVLLWMAEGFLAQPVGGKDMKEVGNDCFDDLVSRSLFQRSKGRGSCFVMHDLINDLAKFVSGEFFFQLEEGDNSLKIVRRTRHFSYAKSEPDFFKKFPGICEAKLLRTFIYMEPYTEQWQSSSYIRDQVTHDLLPTLSRLRVLSLSRHCIFRLPDSIRELKLLQYLNLSGTLIRSLPESICSSYLLQILILRECKNLVVLPTNIGRLINLSHLDIRGTKLQEMPPEMGKLIKLQKLTDFFLRKQSWSSIKELGKLQALAGELCIWNLQDIEEAKDAVEANLKGKKKLKKLKLTWERNIHDSIDSEHDRCVLESLQPQTQLEHLSIHGYCGASFPDWIGHSSFSRIVSLELSGCGMTCSYLPPLGQLASLEYLTIVHFGVEVVGPEFYGSCTSMKKPFGLLKVLSFSYMGRWREWISCEGAFPVLEELHVSSCANLKKVALPGYLPCLTTLDVDSCQQLAVALLRAPAILRVSTVGVTLEKLPSGLYSLISYGLEPFDFVMEIMGRIGLLPNALEKVVIYDSYSLENFPLTLFSEVKTLKVRDSGNLDDFLTPGTNGDITSLDSLEIEKCQYLVSFPEGGLPASNLTRLSLCDCPNLKSLPQNMRSLLLSLVDLRIMSCPALESFPEDGLPSSLSSLSISYCAELEPFPKRCLPDKLESLHIQSCNKLVAGRMQWDLQTIPSLVKLVIERCKDVESFEMLLPSSLISLEINHLHNLKCLDFKGLQNLTSLRELKVCSCRELQYMPKSLHSLVPSFTSLEINHCPKLELFLEGCLPPKLESLEIYACSKLLAHLMQSDLQGLSSLSQLTIAEYGAKDMESFPGKMLLPSTLTSLKIYSLENLKFLDKGLLHLTSLKELQITHCYNLQSLPEEGLPSSLSSLLIHACPLLEQKCRSGAQYRSMISQIPDV